jgi:hypothetical protein
MGAEVRVCEDWFPEHRGFVISAMLLEQIKLLVKNIVDDWDFTIVITGQGRVRIGKSMLAMQIACVWLWLMENEHKLKIPFTIKDNIIFNFEKLISKGNQIGSLHKYMPFIYDEAGETMDSTKTMTPELKAVKDWLRECGQYNFLNIIVLPEFFTLPAGIALTRSTCLIDVYTSTTDEGKFVRGYFRFYGGKAKKKLYLYGKKELNYNATAYDFDGRFYKFYPFDEQEYKKAKIEALKTRETTDKNKLKLTMEILYYLLSKDGHTPSKIMMMIYEASRGNIKVGLRTIQKYIHNFKELSEMPLHDASHINITLTGGEEDYDEEEKK